MPFVGEGCPTSAPKQVFSALQQEMLVFVPFFANKASLTTPELDAEMYVATLISKPENSRLNAEMVMMVGDKINADHHEWLAENEAVDLFLIVRLKDSKSFGVGWSAWESISVCSLWRGVESRCCWRIWTAR